MPKRHLPDRLLSLGLIVLLLALGCLSFDRARRGRYDFHHFYLDAQYAWKHGELNPDLDNPDPDQRRQLPFYLPVVALVLSPIAALGRLPGALLWTVAQVAAFGYSLTVLRRWGAHENPRAPAAAPMGVATVLALPAFIEAARFNQVSYFVLALVLAGASALDRNRPRTAGALLGAAAVLKVLPVIVLPWLLLKRRWSAAVAFAVVSVVLAIVVPLVAFGSQKTVEYHRQWWQYNVRGDAGGAMLNPELPEHFINHRNQSITHVLARFTWPEHPFPAPLQPLQLDRQACIWLGRGITGVLLLAMFWATRRPWRRLSTPRRRAEVAVYAIGLLVFAPLLRQYYLVWAVPAVVLLARTAADGDSPAARRLGWIGLGVWTAGMLAWLWPTARLFGAHLVMLILLGILLLSASRASSLDTGAHVADPRDLNPDGSA